MNRRHMLVGLTVAVPLLAQAETQPSASQVIHRVSASGKVEAPLDSLDLPAWAFHLTSDEYANCAPEHHGSVQAVLPNGERVFVSAETIAGSFMVHHYIEDIAERSHLRAVSSNSQLWSNSDLGISMKVTWDLRLEPVSRQACQLNCEILVETADAALIRAVVRHQPGASEAVRAHCARETPKFAADMESKALKGHYAR